MEKKAKILNKGSHFETEHVGSKSNCLLLEIKWADSPKWRTKLRIFELDQSTQIIFQKTVRSDMSITAFRMAKNKTNFQWLMICKIEIIESDYEANHSRDENTSENHNWREHNEFKVDYTKVFE